MTLLADAVGGMRARALTGAKPVIDLLAGLRGQQMLPGLPDEMKAWAKSEDSRGFSRNHKLIS